jgi:hypothetical protein
MACRAVKKQTITRKDAKTQRLAKNNSIVLFAPSATLREMLSLVQGLFHTFLRHGLRPFVRFVG